MATGSEFPLLVDPQASPAEREAALRDFRYFVEERFWIDLGRYKLFIKLYDTTKDPRFQETANFFLECRVAQWREIATANNFFTSFSPMIFSNNIPQAEKLFSPDGGTAVDNGSWTVDFRKVSPAAFLEQITGQLVVGLDANHVMACLEKPEWFAKLDSSLSFLSLSGASFDSVKQVARFLPSFLNLTKLTLKGCGIGFNQEVTDAVCEMLTVLPQLLDVGLPSNKLLLGQVDLSPLGKILETKPIRSLNLDDNQFCAGSKGLEPFLSCLGRSETLGTLSVSGNFAFRKAVCPKSPSPIIKLFLEKLLLPSQIHTLDMCEVQLTQFSLGESGTLRTLLQAPKLRNLDITFLTVCSAVSIQKQEKIFEEFAGMTVRGLAIGDLVPCNFDWHLPENGAMNYPQTSKLFCALSRARFLQKLSFTDDVFSPEDPKEKACLLKALNTGFPNLKCFDHSGCSEPDDKDVVDALDGLCGRVTRKEIAAPALAFVCQELTAPGQKYEDLRDLVPTIVRAATLPHGSKRTVPDSQQQVDEPNAKRHRFDGSGNK